MTTGTRLDLGEGRFIDTEDVETPKRAKSIPREAWRQEKAKVLARTVIVGDHDFIAHDRSQARGDKSHLWQWKRGVRKATPDTQTIFPPGRHAWFEFKSKGQKPDDDQLLMLERLRGLGDFASWGVMLEDLVNFWMTCGVPLVTNAHFIAMKYDGMVDARIAKAEAGTPAKAARPRKALPRYTAGKRFQARAKKAGVMV